MRPGTMLLVTLMTPTAPASHRASCASSSLPLQHVTPCDVYRRMRSLPVHSFTPAKLGCFASSSTTSSGMSCPVRPGTLYAITGP